MFKINFTTESTEHTEHNFEIYIDASRSFPLFSICAEAAGIKRISVVTRALFMSVSVGKKQIAKGDFFGSFLCQQRNEQTPPLFTIFFHHREHRAHRAYLENARCKT